MPWPTLSYSVVHNIECKVIVQVFQTTLARTKLFSTVPEYRVQCMNKHLGVCSNFSTTLVSLGQEFLTVSVYDSKQRPANFKGAQPLLRKGHRQKLPVFNISLSRSVLTRSNSCTLLKKEKKTLFLTWYSTNLRQSKRIEFKAQKPLSSPRFRRNDHRMYAATPHHGNVQRFAHTMADNCGDVIGILEILTVH